MLTELLTKLDERKKQRAASYMGIVRRIGAGKKVDPADVEAALEAAGKTPVDLTGDVEIYERRARFASVIADSEGLDREQAKLLEQIEEENQILADVQRRHAEAVGPLHEKLIELKGKLQQVDSAREGMKTTMYPDMQAEHSGIRRQLDTLNVRRQALQLRGSRNAVAMAELATVNESIDGLEQQLAAMREELLQP